MDLNDLAQGLPALKAKELRELRARIDFLLKGEPQKTNGNGAEDPVTMVLWAIAAVCYDRGLESRPVEKLAKSQGFAAFAEKVPGVLESLGAQDLSLIQTRFVLKLGLGLTVDQLRDMGVPVSASVLMAQVHRVPGVLDAHFPGYRQAGLLKLVVRNEHE